MDTFKRDNLLWARDLYLAYNTTPPKNFNIRFSSEKGWECEFHQENTCWTEGFTRWIEDVEKVLDLFFSCDPDLVNLDSWQENWNSD